MDNLTETGLALFLVILGVFLIGFVIQFVRQDPGATRLVVLGVRTSLFLPLYALFIFISLCAPNALAALNIPITIVEGYSFYCFYTMIVTNLGGPAKAVQAFKASGKELACCNSCCPSDHVVFYRRTTWALFHFLFTRSVLVILAAIAYYSGTKAGKALYAIFSLASTVILAYALIHIILFCKFLILVVFFIILLNAPISLDENVYESCRNLFGILKAFLLKFSVGLIVLEGLIVQFMTVTGDEPYNDDSTWSAEEQTIRGYCKNISFSFFA
jgi:hypothetical protein